MSSEENRIDQDRALLVDAQSRGPMATLAAFIRLSGPGWLQSAITLGGGSLAGALFLGILGGTSLLWLQLVAITMGVVMLSAISYVTLSTGERPFRAIRDHINPVLAWGWVLATIAANIIWCMPQFSLCFAAVQKNLLGPDIVADDNTFKLGFSGMFLLAASFAVYLNGKQGRAAKLFDGFLKILIGMIVLCFVGVVVLLTLNGQLNWPAIFRGFIPNLSQWTEPAGSIAELMEGLSAEAQAFWNARVVKAQSGVMIAAAATAVGINMTFLMPYSLLKRGWDRTFRGLSRFDLATGMAIPYVVVTSCIVIASATQFHGQADDQFLSNDPAVMQQSPLFSSAAPMLKARVVSAEALAGQPKEQQGQLSEEELARAAALPAAEKQIASSLIKRNAFDLASAIEPLLGRNVSRYVFGLGILGMGFSTIIILMLINGFAMCEVLGKPLEGFPYILGCLIAGGVGACWPFFWQGDSKIYLSIIASSFGMMLLPIAYVTFFFMMNSRRVLGDALPTGGTRMLWNVLMGISVLGAVAAAGKAIMDKSSDPDAGWIVVTLAVVYPAAVVVGFFVRRSESTEEASTE